MKKAKWSVSFPFSFSNLRTKNDLFFVFKNEVRKTKNELVFLFNKFEKKKKKRRYIHGPKIDDAAAADETCVLD